MEREQFFLDLIRELEGWDLPSVADASGVSLSTLYYWMNGTTKSPRISTMIKVGRELGMEPQWKRRGTLRAVA